MGASVKLFVLLICLITTTSLIAKERTVWEKLTENDEYIDFMFEEEFSILPKLYREYGVVTLPAVGNPDIFPIAYIACLEKGKLHYLEDLEDNIIYLKKYHDILHSTLNVKCNNCNTLEDYQAFNEEYEKTFRKYIRLNNGKVEFNGGERLSTAYSKTNELRSQFKKDQNSGRISTIRLWLKNNHHRVKILKKSHHFRDGKPSENSVGVAYLNLVNYFNVAYEDMNFLFENTNNDLFKEYKVNKGPDFENSKLQLVDDVLDNLLSSNLGSYCVKSKSYDEAKTAQITDLLGGRFPPYDCIERSLIHLPHGAMGKFSNFRRYYELTKAGFQPITPKEEIIRQVKDSYKKVKTFRKKSNSTFFEVMTPFSGWFNGSMKSYDEHGRLRFKAKLETKMPENYSSLKKVFTPLGTRGLTANPNYEYENFGLTFVEYNDNDEITRVIEKQSYWIPEKGEFLTTQGKSELRDLSLGKNSTIVNDVHYRDGLLNGVSTFNEPFFSANTSESDAAEGFGIIYRYFDFKHVDYSSHDFKASLIINFVDGFPEGEAKLYVWNTKKPGKYLAKFRFEDGALDIKSVIHSEIIRVNE